MVWNYRVIAHKQVFYIHEVYYNDNGDICGISEEPMHPQGTSLAELKRDPEHFLLAFNKPVLKKEKIKFAEMDAMKNRTVGMKSKRLGKTSSRKQQRINK